MAETLEGIGPQPFSWFMREALYDPVDGYYASGPDRIGREGDYYTSVSVGTTFARLIGEEFRRVWEKMGRPARFDIVEQGANDGKFAADFFTWCELEAPGFFSCLRYRIIEPQIIPRARQAECLKRWRARVEWAESASALENLHGVWFGNELLDAFPVHLIRLAPEDWRELYVAWDGERFVLEPGRLSDPVVAERIAAIPDAARLPEGYTTEVCLEIEGWAASVNTAMERGVVLLADYGRPATDYYAPHRHQGTLRGFSKHRRVADLLAEPGCVDLTADVNFTHLAEAFLGRNWTPEGFTDQHHYLVGAGEPLFAAIETAGDSLERRAFLSAYRALMHPGTMGMAFHFFAASKSMPDGTGLTGFRHARDAASALGLFS